MAKKQTRRSISVSRTTYERLKAFCETNNISMSQLVETRVNDFLGTDVVAPVLTPSVPVMSGASSISSTSSTSGAPFRPLVPRVPPVSVPPIKPVEAMAPRAVQPVPAPAPTSMAAPAQVSPPAPPVPMTSVAARFAVEPPPPIIKPRQDTAAPKPAEKRPEQIFTF